MQKFSGQGNSLTQSANKIIRSGLTGNCKKLCPPNSAFERYKQLEIRSPRDFMIYEDNN